MREIGMKIAIGILGIIFFASFVLSVYYSSGTVLADIGKGQAKENKIHFAAVLVGNETQFLNAIEKGMGDKASELDVDIEYFRTNDVAEATEIIDMLVTANADGIITQGIQDAAFREALQNVKEEDIPLILMTSDDHTIARDGYVGVNPFEYGSVAAGVFMSHQVLPGKVVFITQTQENVDENATGKLQMQGFLDVFETHHRELQVISKMSDSTLLSAEGIVSDLFLENSDLTGVVCTNEVDTLGVVQVVVDLNKVGKVTVVGTGLTEQIADYINKGIICGTLFRDPQTIGEMSVEGLYKYYGDRETEWNYQDIPVTVITKENINQYYQSEDAQ